MNTVRLLPRTRTFQRRRPWMAWWVAVTIAVITNLILVVVLSQISNLQLALTEPPLTVRTFRHIEAETPPPLPLPSEAHEQPPEPQQEPPLVALPTLELPSEPTTATLLVPSLPNLQPALNLPLNVPAFSALAAQQKTEEANLWPGTGQPDESAQLESTFDLERFYPRSARLRGISGQCRVRLTILEDGTVLTVHIFESNPRGVFEQATRELGQSLRFRPGRVAGKPVASTKDLIIDWTLK